MLNGVFGTGERLHVAAWQPVKVSTVRPRKREKMERLFKRKGSTSSRSLRCSSHLVELRYCGELPDGQPHLRLEKSLAPTPEERYSDEAARKIAVMKVVIRHVRCSVNQRSMVTNKSL